MSQAVCPICKARLPGNWQDYPDYPFCSKRCRIIDLGRWLGEDYKLAGKNTEENRSTTGESGEDPDAGE